MQKCGAADISELLRFKYVDAVKEAEYERVLGIVAQCIRQAKRRDLPDF